MWRGEHDLEPVHNVGGSAHSLETGEFFFTCTLAGIRNTVLNLELALASEMYGFN